MKGTVPPSVTMQHIYRGIIPFVALQLVAVVVCIVWPEVVLWLPRYFGFLD
jgi:TRAP-type mannitol/chloroaromatic compound transport system permease large subunit